MITSIIFDSREPDWVQNLKLGVPTMTSQLETGDAWISTEDNCLIVVERKTPNDLLESIKDRRLFNQAARMKQLTPYAYVVITGAIIPNQNGKTTIYNQTQGWVETGWNHAAIQGALLSLQEIGVMVCECSGDQDYGPCILRLANRSRDAMPVLPVRETTVFNGAEAVLAALPGIGPNRAAELMRHFPNVAYALYFLTDLKDTKTKIPGIGEGTKRNIVKALGASLIINGELQNGQ